MEITHPQFISRLKGNDDARIILGIWFLMKGWEITLPPLKISPTHSLWNHYKDHGDLFIKKDSVTYQIEVKSVSRNFTDIEDWPFPDFIVMAKHAYDEKRPYAIFCLNPARDSVGKVYASSEDRWEVRSIEDTRYDPPQIQEFYVASLSDVTFSKLVFST